MKVRCAWCGQEGKPGLLGEKPPLDDPTETHGICQRHWREMVEALPSTSFPGVELLIVVHPKSRELFDYLQRQWAGVRGVKVILDRRYGERRRTPRTSKVAERRTPEDRRVRQSQPGVLGCVFVWFERRPKASS